MASPTESGGDIFIPAPLFTFTAGLNVWDRKMCVMGNGKNNILIDEVRDMDMVSYLSLLGHEPVKIRRAAYWYLSPLREERTASFKVDRALNLWYDHGVGKGGNIIDFGILHHNCSVSEFLQAVRGNSFLPAANDFKEQSHEKEAASRIIVNDVFPVCSKALINYLGTRKIPLEITILFCYEVRFSLYQKNYFAIGFKNDLGGYELRNKFFKGSSSTKGITTIKNGHPTLSVFEGFSDLLSYKVLAAAGKVPHTDFLVLNSLSFFEASGPLMESYNRSVLYLDNDAAGQMCVSKALSLSPVYEDGSSLYAGFKDLNHFLIQSSNTIIEQDEKQLPDESAIPGRKRFNRRI